MLDVIPKFEAGNMVVSILDAVLGDVHSEAFALTLAFTMHGFACIPRTWNLLDLTQQILHLSLPCLQLVMLLLQSMYHCSTHSCVQIHHCTPCSIPLVYIFSSPLPFSAWQYRGVSQWWTGLESNGCHLHFHSQVDSSKNIQFTSNYNQFFLCETSSAWTFRLSWRSKFQARSASSMLCMLQNVTAFTHVPWPACACPCTVHVIRYVCMQNCGPWISRHGWSFMLPWSSKLWLMMHMNVIIFLLQTGNTSYEAIMYGLPATREGLVFQVSAWTCGTSIRTSSMPI